MINQLTLGVGLKDEATFANYYPGKNGPLIQELKKVAEGNGERVIYFCGSGGQGCTHLLQAVCHEANRNKLTSVYIPLGSLIDYSPAIFEGLESLMLVCVDDLHLIANRPAWEEAFFHAYNRIHDAGGRLIVTANVMPKSLGVAMPDVVSRLSWGIVYQLQALTDKEKLAVLMMRAERRGMTLSEEVGKFILNHCPRHMSTLFAALEALDKASLAAQRKLTIPFVKSILEI
ncbi:MAG: DnaA regulatory inactivator Hda [Gammaproteobacteria bacterium]|nr:DnaA regulatory inactivator Hda [Gammaproteobacteria bacterium]